MRLITPHKIVKTTMDELNLLGSSVQRLEIAWIKAHCGHKGNEAADDMARETEDIEEIDMYVHCGILDTLQKPSQRTNIHPMER